VSYHAIFRINAFCNTKWKFSNNIIDANFIDPIPSLTHYVVCTWKYVLNSSHNLFLSPPIRSLLPNILCQTEIRFDSLIFGIYSKHIATNTIKFQAIFIKLLEPQALILFLRWLLLLVTFLWVVKEMRL